MEVQGAADDCRVRMQGNIKHLLTNALPGFVAVLPEGEIPDRFFENERLLRVQPDVVAEADAELKTFIKKANYYSQLIFFQPICFFVRVG